MHQPLSLDSVKAGIKTYQGNNKLCIKVVTVNLAYMDTHVNLAQPDYTKVQVGSNKTELWTSPPSPTFQGPSSPQFLARAGYKRKNADGK